MTTYFIDFQNGCDENDGLRPETPFLTQHPKLLQPDDTVLFRRGSGCKMHRSCFAFLSFSGVRI